MAPPKHTIIIVGSGIAGPTLALTILKHPDLSQYTPLLLDRLPAASAYFSGAGVVLSSNALYPLTQLGIHDALWSASAEAIQTSMWRSRVSSEPVQGRYLNSLHNPNWSADLSTGLRVIERSALMRVLVDAVVEHGGVVEWGAKVVGVEQTRRGVEVLLESGERREGGLVVGADGGWSVVRKCLLADWKPEFAYASGLYGISRRPQGTDEEVLGRGHVVLLDVGGVATWVLPGGRQWWTVSLPESAAPSGRSEVVESAEFGTVTTGGYSLESTEEILRGLEKVWYPGVGECGAFFRDSEKIVRVSLWQRVFKEAEIANAGEGQDGNVVLIGDAGRIMLPTSGQGACMSIEDATILANAILNNPPSGDEKPNFSSALSEYTKLRLPRSTSIAKQAYWSGIAFMAERWWWRWLRDFFVAWAPMDRDPKARIEKGGKSRDPNEWLYGVRYEVKLGEGRGASDGL